MGEENLGQQFLGKVVNDSYADLVKPSAEVIGQGLAGVFKVLMFYPRLWGELSDLNLKAKVDDFQEKVQQKYQAIPEERRQLPPPSIVLPLFQALEHKIFDDELRNLFAALLAASMDSENKVHPEFVDFVRRMDSTEAKFLRDCFELSPGDAYDFAPIFRSSVTFDLRSQDLAVGMLHTRYAGDTILELIPRRFENEMSGRLTKDLTVFVSGVMARTEMEYLLYPAQFESSDIEVMIEHLQSLGIVEFREDVYQGAGLYAHMTKEEEYNLIQKSLSEEFLTDKELFADHEQIHPILTKGSGATEFKLFVDYKILQPTKFGLRFLQLCMNQKDS